MTVFEEIPRGLGYYYMNDMVREDKVRLFRPTLVRFVHIPLGSMANSMQQKLAYFFIGNSSHINKLG